MAMDVFFFVFLLPEHSSNCSFGIELDGIYYTHSPKISQPVSSLEEEVFVGCENRMFALVHNKPVISNLMVNSFPECHIQIPFRRSYPCIYTASH